ncbi:MAG: hypothetical protein ACRCWF_15670, partial [Beijerinckiaceae bacterium]
VSSISARSFSVGRGLQQGRFTIALSIDFLSGRASSRENAGQSIAFVDPDDGIFMPASIGLLRNAQNLDGARRFIQFLLSNAGQSLVASAEVNRLPSDSRTYLDPSTSGLRNPFEQAVARRAFVSPFNVSLSASRYDLVNLLFDELITYPLAPLQRAMQLLRAAEQQINAETPEDIAREVSAIRRIIMRLPVNAASAKDAAFTQGFQRIDRGVPAPLNQAAQVAAWRRDAADRYAQASRDAITVLTRLGVSIPPLAQP